MQGVHASFVDKADPFSAGSISYPPAANKMHEVGRAGEHAD